MKSIKIIKINLLIISIVGIIITGCNNSGSSTKTNTENKSALAVGQKLLKGAINIKQKDFPQKNSLISK